MTTSKAIWIAGPPASGKSMSVGQIMMPLWEMRVCKVISENHDAELESFLESDKVFLHLERFPENPSKDLINTIDQLLEKETVIFITSQNPPPSSMMDNIIWLQAKEYPFKP